MMKPRFIIIALLYFILVAPMAALASNISNALYFGVINVTNNSTATTNVATTANISTSNLINGGYLNSSADNGVIRNSSGADVPFMPSVNASFPWAMWVPSIGADSIRTYILYTANSSDGEIRYFPASGGMTTVDSATLELGDNFTVEQRGRVNTDAGIDKNLFLKDGAFRTWVTSNEIITSSIRNPADDYLDFVSANSDWVQILDDDDFSFTDGAGNDEPFSLIAWVNFDEIGGSRTIIAKYDPGNDREWRFFAGGPAGLHFQLIKFDDIGARIGRATADISGDNGNWIHVAATYDGSETSAGINIYLNGVDIDNADDDAGAYTGMSNTASDVEIGSQDDRTASFLNGGLAEVKIYAKELTSAQVASDFSGAVSTTDLKGYWKFDEGTGNPVDSSGNGHNANVNLADWVTGFPGWRSDISVTATGVSSGEHTIKVSANTTHIWIDIDDVLVDSVLLSGSSVVDNANNWTVAENNVMPYMEFHKITVGGILQQHIIWEYSTTFTDQSGNGHDATPTFIASSSDADVSAEMVSFQPISEAKAPDFVLGEAPAFIDSDALTGNVTGTFGTTPGTSTGTFPLAGVITSIADASGTPAQLPLLVIAVFMMLAGSLTVSATIRRHGSGSLIIKIIAIAAFMGIFIALANFSIDFWMLVVFLVIAIAIAFASRQLGWT